MANTTRTARKSTPRKATPAKATAPAATNGKPAAFDFGSLTVGESASLPSSGARGLDVASTPFPAAVDASWAAAETKSVTIRGEKQDRQYGSVKTVTVPEAMVDKTVRLIRRAADHLDGVGVRVVPGKPQNGNVTIAFRAQTKRAGSED